MVVFYHFRYMDPGHFKGASYVMSAPQFLLCFCSASIPMFFMVNGALMLNKNRSVQEIYRKAGRLALVSLVWNKLVGFYTWFFYALIVLYLLYPIFIRAFNAENRIYLYLIMAAVFVMPFMYNFVVLLLERFCPDFSFIFFGQTISLKTIPLRTGVHRLYSILYFLLGGVLLNKRLTDPVLVLYHTWSGDHCLGCDRHFKLYGKDRRRRQQLFPHGRRTSPRFRFFHAAAGIRLCGRP